MLTLLCVLLTAAGFVASGMFLGFGIQIALHRKFAVDENS